MYKTEFLIHRQELLNSVDGQGKNLPLENILNFGKMLYAHYFENGVNLEDGFRELASWKLDEIQRQIVDTNLERLSFFKPTEFIESLRVITENLNRLGVNFFVQNGTSMYIRGLDHKIVRIPTDIDICVPDADLFDLKDKLGSQGLDFTYEATGPEKWGFHYVEPQLRTEFNGVNIDLIAKSQIRSLSDPSRVYNSDYNGVRPDFKNMGTFFVPLAPLDIVEKNKRFQSRPLPKQDLDDLTLIEMLKV